MKTNRRGALLLLGSTLLASCAAPQTVSPHTTDPFEGGIGGTGFVGTVFGNRNLSIHGLKVDLSANTSVTSPIGPRTQIDLAPGQVLTVFARKAPDGIMSREISIDFALVGDFKVNGANASVNSVPLIGWQGALGQGRTGQRVAVSGTWTPNGVRPSRIDPAPQSMDVIAGTFDGAGVGGVTMETRSSRPMAGSYTVAFGRSQNDGFRVEQFKSGRFTTANGLKYLSVDGYLETERKAPGFRIAGLGHSFASDVQLGQIGQRRAIYFGAYTGRFDARIGVIVPDDFRTRDRVLRDGLDLAGSSSVLRL